MTNLLEKIAKVDKKGKVRLKQVTEDELRRMNPWEKKSWSTRVRRWLRMMPTDLAQRNPWEKHTRRRVKEWVKDNVSRRGEDGILWGRWNADNTGVMGKDEASPLPKEREPPTSRKQMRKLGEPPRKVQRTLSIPRAVEEA